MLFCSVDISNEEVEMSIIKTSQNGTQHKINLLLHKHLEHSSIHQSEALNSAFYMAWVACHFCFLLKVQTRSITISLIKFFNYLKKRPMSRALLKPLLEIKTWERREPEFCGEKMKRSQKSEEQKRDVEGKKETLNINTFPLSM